MKVAINADRDISSLHLSGPDSVIMNTCIAMSSDVWTGLVDGKVACMWGVAPPSLLSFKAYLWLYTTDVLKEHQFVFVRHSQVEIKRLLEEYDLIVGHCVLGATQSMRWLKWLGATFGEPERGLIPFQIRKK
jgi:hypothetical protein